MSFRKFDKLYRKREVELWRDFGEILSPTVEERKIRREIAFDAVRVRALQFNVYYKRVRIQVDAYSQ